MRHLLAACAVLLLSGCSTLDMHDGAKLRTLDYLRDDLASLVIAFDLPRGVAPLAGASTLGVDVAGSSPRHLKLTLAEADADEIAAGLPPPGQGRAYYLFGFADPDKAAIREIQLAARNANVAATAVTLTLAPRFCRSGSLDPHALAISVLAALPGDTSLAPLIDRQNLADALAASGGDLPPCA